MSKVLECLIFFTVGLIAGVIIYYFRIKKGGRK